MAVHRLLFLLQISSVKTSTRSENSNKAKTPVPGSGVLAANLLARAWNEAPLLQNAPNLGATKSAAQKWARSL